LEDLEKFEMLIKAKREELEKELQSSKAIKLVIFEKYMF